MPLQPGLILEYLPERLLSLLPRGIEVDHLVEAVGRPGRRRSPAELNFELTKRLVTPVAVSKQDQKRTDFCEPGA